MSLGNQSRVGSDSTSRTFARLMSAGKVKAALRILSANKRGRVIGLDEAVPLNCAEGDSTVPVRDVLESKHPKAQSVYPEALVSPQARPTHPVIFERLTGTLIRSVALQCQGAAGPSGLDASSWKRMCTMYHASSKHLCDAIAASAKRLCCAHIDPAIMQPFIACRLIPLSKDRVFDQSAFVRRSDA